MKKALLDTDFIFKTNIARNGKQEPLSDLIMRLEGYEFFCHEKILEELSFHTLDPDPVTWLEDKIETGNVKCLSDSDILYEFENDYGAIAPRLYMDLLKVSCDSFSLSFFNRFYGSLRGLADNADSPVFLSALKNCEVAIGNGNSMGERKTFVLAQMLQLKYPGQVVVFCSDDNRARQCATYISSEIRCLSIPAVFQKLRNVGLEKETLKPYYDSLSSFYSLHGQKTMKVWIHESLKRINLDFEQLFEEIYLDKFEIKRTGDLRYRE